VPFLLIGDDAVRPMHRLLALTKEMDRIDLLLYTRGGGTTSAYRIVKMIREYCKCFTVLVPFRAHSAGTQICLGADSIVMGKLGELSPVDPTTVNMFNPILNPQGNPADPGNRVPISVEDVRSYLEWARDKVGLTGKSDRLEVFRVLTNRLEPLALGNVNRVYNEIRITTRSLLGLHMNQPSDSEKINKIVQELTEEYTHEYIITRDRAREMGLKILPPDEQQEETMMSLWEEYEKELKMWEPFDVWALESNQPTDFKWLLGFIESELGGYAWVTEGTVYPRPQQSPPSDPPPVRIKKGGWIDISQVSGPFA
jgi:hypothetical protein